MKKLSAGLVVALVVAVLGASPTALAPPAAAARPKRLLFFTKSSGYEHAVIKAVDGQPSVAQKAMAAIAARNGFEVTHSKDGSVFTPAGIAGYDGFIFFTSGDLTTPGNDKNPPMPAEGKTTLLDAIARGKAFIGIHQATGTFHSPGDRYLANGDDVDPYIKMVGGEFIQHGVQQKAKVFCADARFPGFHDCRDSFELHEEWYSYKNLGKDLHVLLSVATWGLKNTGKDSVYRRPPYPVAWVRRHGKGRVFYTGLGHREDVWSNPRFEAMLVGGIKWATGQATASIKPNVAVVTPGYDQLPPKDPLPGAPDGGAPTAPTPAAAK